MQTTPNYGFRKPADNEIFDQQEHANYNFEQIDTALTPTADPAQIPTGNGPGKLVQWVGWLTNRIKAISGKTNWYDAPTKSLEQLNTDVNAHLADFVRQPGYAVTTGSANTYAATLDPVLTAYTDGMAVSVKINVDNTGASTINVNSLGAKTIKKSNGNDISAGNLKIGSIYTLRYNGTNFILQGEGASGNATASDLLSGKTASTDAGDITGTMINKVGSVTILTPSTVDQAIPQGYYGGAVGDGKVVGNADLTSANIKSGVNIFGISGSVVEATGNAVVGDVLATKTFSKAGSAGLTGTMPNNGAYNITPGINNVTIPAGYHNGAGVVYGDADLVSGNIKSGINIFGVVGNVSPRLYASGSITSSTSINFYDYEGVIVSSPYVLVSGLSFQPSLIVINWWDSLGHTDFTVVFPTQATYSYSYPSDAKVINSYNYSTTHTELYWRLDGAYIYVTSSGFRIPVYWSNKDYTWWAFA